MQHHPISQFPYFARKSSHAATIFFRRTWQFGQVQSIHKWTVSLNRRRWSPADTLPYDENLLRHTLGLSLRVNSNTEFYPDSVQVIKRNQFALQLDSDKKTESDKESTSTVTTKGELQSSNQREKQQLSEDEELPFQQGLPLKEDSINLKNSRPQSRNFHGLSFGCYKPKS